MTGEHHPAAGENLHYFITGPGQTDTMLVVVGILLIAAVLLAFVFFFWLHSLPERMVHNKVQFDLVAVLVLLSLFTHIHAFWVAALILAVIKIPEFNIPDVLTPLSRIAVSTEELAKAQTAQPAPAPAPPSPKGPASPQAPNTKQGT